MGKTCDGIYAVTQLFLSRWSVSIYWVLFGTDGMWGYKGGEGVVPSFPENSRARAGGQNTVRDVRTSHLQVSHPEPLPRPTHRKAPDLGPCWLRRMSGTIGPLEIYEVTPIRV